MGRRRVLGRAESFWKTVNGNAVEEPALNSVWNFPCGKSDIEAGRNPIRERCFPFYGKKKRFSVRISRLIIEIFDSTFENFVWKFIFISHGFMKRNIVRGRIFLCRRFFFFVSDEDFTRFYLFTGWEMYKCVAILWIYISMQFLHLCNSRCKIYGTGTGFLGNIYFIREIVGVLIK